MNKLVFRRGMGIALTLTMAMAAVPSAALAAEHDGLCVHHPIHNELCGHTDGQDCLFTRDACRLCEAGTGLTTILGTDVVIDGYTFPYTGKEIQPSITVTVGEATLSRDTHYTLTYQDNVEPGTGSVTVTGIPEAGFDGIVTIPFTIEAPVYTLTEIKGTDVVLEGTEFPYSGQAVEPAVTVTVNGTVLTGGKDYSVHYANNVEPGTASVTVKGIATASQTQGYTGEVVMEFTITPAPTKPEDTDKPEEETKPEQETKPVQYQITKGSGATWYQGSGKTLSFTADGAYEDFTGVSINGKTLGKSYFTAGKGTAVTLTKDFLNKLAVGKYTISIHFADGSAEGSFTVSDKLDTTNPVTGDSTNVGLWLTLAAGSLAALGGAGLVMKKKER